MKLTGRQILLSIKRGLSIRLEMTNILLDHHHHHHSLISDSPDIWQSWIMTRGLEGLGGLGWLGSQEAVNSQSNVHHNSLSTVVSDKIWPKRRTNHTQNPFVPIFTHPAFPPKSSLELSDRFWLLNQWSILQCKCNIYRIKSDRIIKIFYF